MRPWCIPFPIWNQSIVSCLILSAASWPAYRSQEAGQVVWYSHLLKNFPQFVVIHTVKGFGIFNKAEVDVFLEFSCFFCDSVDVGNLISVSSAFLNPTWTSASSLFTYCWSLASRILSITLLACEMSAIVQYSLISRWWSIRTCTYLLWEAQNYNLLLNNCWRRMFNPTRKYPTSKGKGEAPARW